MKTRSLRNRLVAAALLAAVVNFAPVHARAASKEIIALQTQVQQLLDMVQRLQSTLDTRFTTLQTLAQQTADNAAKMEATVDTLQQKLAAQSEAISGKVDSASGQVQSVSDSIEELKSRLDKLQASVQAIQSQLQNLQAPPQPAQPATGPGGIPGPNGQPTGPAANPAPPLQDTFQAALRDFNGARYSVAQGEFQDVIQYYPQDDLAGQSQFYLGEIAYHQKDYENAIKAYNAVLEGFPDSSKAPAAQLHKAYAELDEGRRSSGVEEMRSLIKRHPQSPEAQQARHRLDSMGVRIVPR
jgi:tol-pal system protein YbgF